MKVILESTSKMVVLDGVPARVWEGHTQAGVQVHAFITRIAVKRDADQTQFEAELVEQRDPSPEVAVIPLRLIL